MSVKINIKSLLMLLVAMAISSNFLIAGINFQDDDKLSQIVSTFTQKVLLTKEQETKVLTILTKFTKDAFAQPEKKDAFLKEAQSQIEGLLDKKQKMKYDIIKNDLWKEISKM